MYLKRKVYEKFMDWKENTSQTTLEVEGARQVGKTYLINKFADENFKHKIYVNLFEMNGANFMECFRKGTSWTPGTPRPEQPLHDVFRLYDPDFVDAEDTVIIIDEIQESADIYNRIREFTRYFKARFIVTGSYLGRVYDKEFRYSSGDVTSVTIYTLSFEEFLEAYDCTLYEQYLHIKDADENEDVHGRLRAAYGIYCQIGGYPKVVQAFLETKDMEKAREEIVRIIRTFTSESVRYFKDILDEDIFRQIFLSICRMLNREKKGLNESSASEELQKLVTRTYSSNLSKETCNRAIKWLHSSGILGYCAKITEMDILDFILLRRIYFMDMGLANYYFRLAGTDERVLKGLLNETYVYINLVKRQQFPQEIAFETPAFATYRGGKIDFIVKSMRTGILYALEVKSGKGSAVTGQKALEHGKVNRLLLLKGDTKGGTVGKVETVPIYYLEQYKF